MPRKPTFRLLCTVVVKQFSYNFSTYHSIKALSVTHNIVLIPKKRRGAAVGLDRRREDMYYVVDRSVYWPGVSAKRWMNAGATIRIRRLRSTQTQCRERAATAEGAGGTSGARERRDGGRSAPYRQCWLHEYSSSSSSVGDSCSITGCEPSVLTTVQDRLTSIIFSTS